MLLTTIIRKINEWARFRRNMRELALQTGSEAFELTGTKENLAALMQLVTEAVLPSAP